jgi:hypothetical protein
MNVLTELSGRVMMRVRSTWRWQLAIVLLIGVAQLTLTKETGAQAGQTYSVTWASASANTLVRAGAYQINATVGQPEVGLQRGGDYNLGGGFWGSTTPAVTIPLEESQRLYLPAVRR